MPRKKLYNFNDILLAIFSDDLTIAVAIINNLSTAVVLLKQERKLISVVSLISFLAPV